MSQKPFLLAAEGLNKSFDGFKAINDLNFYLDEGELRTVIGPNGAGKTTFLDLITGRTQPDEGTLLWDDAKHDLLKLNEYEIYRLGIGRKFQTPTVYNDHTVTENLILSPRRIARHLAQPVRQNHFRPTRPDRGDPPHHQTPHPGPPQGRHPRPRPETMARNRHAARPGGAPSVSG